MHESAASSASAPPPARSSAAASSARARSPARGTAAASTDVRTTDDGRQPDAAEGESRRLDDDAQHEAAGSDDEDRTIASRPASSSTEAPSITAQRNRKAASRHAAFDMGEKHDGSTDGDEEKERELSSPTTDGSAPGEKGATNRSDKPARVRRYKWVPGLTRKAPRAPYKSLEDAPYIPDRDSNVFSRWTYQWIHPLMSLGNQRVLQPEDMWKIDPSRESAVLADKLMARFNARRERVERWNASLDSGEYVPSTSTKAWWRVRKSVFGVGRADGRREVGLFGALSDTFFWQFWSAGFLKLLADLAQVFSPLVTRALITYATSAYYFHRGVPGYEDRGVGEGVGMAIGLWAMQIFFSTLLHQFFVRSMGVGVLARAALIAAIYRHAMRLSPKARTTVTNGKLVNHISTDVSRIDFAAGFAHMSWTSAIVFIVIVVILIIELGPSSLAGVGFLVVMIPLQSFAMKKLFMLRRKAMVWTDKRVKLTQELLGGMRIIKLFAWEIPYLNKLNSLRDAEMVKLRSLLIIRAFNQAIAMSLPFLATVIAFLVYIGIGNTQDPATIFTSFTLYNLLRMPLMMLPMSLSTITDAWNGLGRLTQVFLAEQQGQMFALDPSAKYAVEVVDGWFKWEGAPPEELSKKDRKKQARAVAKEQATTKPVELAKPTDTEAILNVAPTDGATGPATARSSNEVQDDEIQLRDINIAVPRGSLVAIVGAVGSGKSSLLQALIGEMKRVNGEVTFGGSIAFCPQQAWIQNCTVKDNILFGRPFDEERYDQVVHDACLEADLAILPAGDLTEIGERGVTLSGGQRQRINIARAMYADQDIVLLDDPLSAVDAHVGKHLFDHAIRGHLGSKTRFLVTHALHFVSECDYVLGLDKGRIVQQGTYAELTSRDDSEFRRVMEEFGGVKEEEKVEEEQEAEEEVPAEKASKPVKQESKRLMQEEERAEGFDGNVYARYLTAANGYVTLPILIVSLLCVQGALVVGSYWLVWWQVDQFNQSQGFYMGIYAVFGVLQAVFMFTMGTASVYIGYNASRTLHRTAARSVLHAPMSFFDTSPLGRVMNRFSKDMDNLDTTLNDAMRMSFSTVSSVVGAIVLIAIVQPYFLIAVAVVLTAYWFIGRFYLRSAREIKRVDNLLRSVLYAFFSESLSGLATVRAYGEVERFQRQNERLIDIQNRAYLLTTVNQRYLAFRLDMLGALLTFVVAIISVAGRYTINPSEIGLVLSYVLMIQGAFSWMVRQIAEVVNDMNSVERLVYYSDQLEQERPARVQAVTPDKSWPEHGSVKLDSVVMAYRPGLPAVLKNMSLDVRGGEKVGIVGRTGAGKSSILTALFRLVELQSGSITVDGQNIADIGLADLREKIAIIPQEPLLFNGTLRTNLDPFGVYEDARLWDAVRRAGLVAQSSGDTATRFSLDLAIDDEGNNLSVGERSLVSLARALVKDSKIIMLDEATASVDFATDNRIQATIRQEFKDKTLLCIAHRLRTIVNYDRVLVMDDGQVAEYDTPLALFDQRGIFHSMCERSGIRREDIEAVSF